MTKTEKLLSFISASPTCYHTVANISSMLEKSGFRRLNEFETWELSKGGRYYVTRNASSVIAFRVPTGDPSGFMISAAHSDSPCFKIKRLSEIESGKYIKINTERYGGMLYSTWLDRPLSVAGRVIIRDGGKLKTRLVAPNEDILIIPNVAIHMNRSANDGFSYNPAVDLVPLYSSDSGKSTFLSKIAAYAGVKPEDVVDFDLFVVNRQEGFIWGNAGEYFSAPRIDDLQCAFAVTEAIAIAEEKSGFPVCAVFDNEEVGSLTKQGADSTFLADTLDRICASLYGENALGKLLASGMMLSADNAHAVHPNHPEYSDPTHRPYMNGGVVIKYNANQKYTTDAVSGALFAEICKKNGINVQYFANRSDIAGGSTLGNISNAHVSLNTVDIGCAQLAMHSSFETAGSRDTDTMVKAISSFFETSLKLSPDGEYEII